MPAFAAAFLGATTINPGRFNAWGTVIAVYFLVTGITGLQLLGAQSFVQNIFYGIALIAAVSFSQVVRRRRNAGAQMNAAAELQLDDPLARALWAAREAATETSPGPDWAGLTLDRARQINDQLFGRLAATGEARGLEVRRASTQPRKSDLA